MIAAVPRAAACAALAAFLGAALFALFYGMRPALTAEFDRELPRLVGGISPPERDNTTGLTFAWTAREAVLRLPDIDRRTEWTLHLRVRGARPQAADNPALEFFADGVAIATQQTKTDFEDVQVRIPARPERRGAVISMRADRTFSPGPADPRELGVMLDRLQLVPASVVVPPRDALGAVATAAAAIAAALALLGLGLAMSVGGAVAIAAGASLLMAKGFAPYTNFPSTGLTLALWTAFLMVALGRLIEWRNGKPLRNTARFAIAFSACAGFIKLLVLLHPNMPIGDALFHAHRFRTVVEGNFYFTSIAPGNYQFPYAPGLYVAAMPFAAMVARATGDMTLLRLFIVVADAVAGGLLYVLVVRAWGDRLAAAIAVALYHLAPAEFAVARSGNLTNAFAQSLAVGALVLMADPALRLGRWIVVALLALILAAAFMSHTSTFAILFPTCVFISAAFALRGGGPLRSPAAAVLLAAVVALIAAIALYYAHFGDVYRAEFARISAETTGNVPDAGGRTAGDRLATVPRYLWIFFGLPLLILTAIGTWRLVKRPAPDRGTLAVAGWTSACVLFFVIGILTPVDMRYYLAAVPAIAIAGGAGASWLWGTAPVAMVLQDMVRRGAALGLLGWAIAVGVLYILNF